jgi:hypothetical protein
MTRRRYGLRISHGQLLLPRAIEIHTVVWRHQCGGRAHGQNAATPPRAIGMHTVVWRHQCGGRAHGQNVATPPRAIGIHNVAGE